MLKIELSVALFCAARLEWRTALVLAGYVDIPESTGGGA